MHRGALDERWNHTAAALCQLANLHRDPRTRPSPYTLPEFHPFAQPAAESAGIPADITVLKAFLPPEAQR